MSKAKRAERAIKLTNSILTGHARLEFYEKQKKQSQANRIGGATPDGNSGALAERYMRLLRILLPGILAMLSMVDDPRNPNKITHSLPVLLLYGILMFISHTTSRRAANREIGGSKASELMEELLPDFISMPHADTLARLLEDIREGALEQQYECLLKEFIKSDTFRC